MLKKELEEKFKNLQDDYQYLENIISDSKQRVWENISYIEQALQEEKNKQKRKLLEGLKQEFQYIYNKLDLDELPF